MTDEKLGLIVGADQVTAAAIAKGLRSHGYRPCEIGTLAEAIDTVQRIGCELIFCELPILAALSLIAACRGASPCPRVVLMADQFSPQTLIDAMRAGFGDVLVKPATDLTMEAIVDRMLNDPLSAPHISITHHVRQAAEDMPAPHMPTPSDTSVKATTAALVDHVIRQCDGNKSAAAKILGISRRTIYRILERRHE